MSLRSLVQLPVPLLTLLPIASLVNGDCYLAAYGLIGEVGWNACPGTATKAGGAEICCMGGSECGEDSICHDPSSDAWYVAGCTDSSFDDPVCNNVCVSYTQTYIQYEDSSQEWMCCGSGGCNGTVTDDTFAGPSPESWKVITGSSAPSTTAASPTSTADTASPDTVTPAGVSTSSAGLPTSTNSDIPTSTGVTSKATSYPGETGSYAFKPTPIHKTIASGASGTPVTESSNASHGSDGDDNHGSSGGLSTGAQAGIGAAIGVAALALIVGLVAICMLRKNRKSKEVTTDEVHMKMDTVPAYTFSGHSPYFSSGMHTASTVSELPTNPPVYEVGGAENEVRHKQWRPWQNF